MSRILIIDDDIASCKTLSLHLQSQGHEVYYEHDVEAGGQVAVEVKPQLLILDIRLPGQSGLEALPALKKSLPNTHIIMITAHHDMASTIKAMQDGAEDYIHKPIDIHELDEAIARILDDTREQSRKLTVNNSKYDKSEMVGKSSQMRTIFKTIGLVAGSPATVLITGESGTGKELVARAVHNNSAHADGPFVVINCAALVETLLESDMFGHEKGAFTGAIARQPGKFSLANNGTIFLDEIGELSIGMQAKLLRVLQNKEFTPLGGKKALTTNARIIAATNVNLPERVAEGRFREDLYYRLQVVSIHIPPLRERMEDIDLLIQTLLARVNKELHKHVDRIHNDVLDVFHRYPWHGNVRQLENVLLKAVALSSTNTISMALLPAELAATFAVAGTDALATGSDDANAPLNSLHHMEKHHVLRVLDAVDWHKGHACEILKVSRPRLRRLIKEHHLAPASADLPGAVDDFVEAD